MSTNFERIVSTSGALVHDALPLHDVAHTRWLEAQYTRPHSKPTLMQSAGLALAQWTLALAPHAKVIWIACGPGNNGGDGMEAAAHLQSWGKQPVITLVHDPAHSPSDAQQAWHAARVAQVCMQREVPLQFDVCLDALFGIGLLRPLQPPYADWVRHMNACPQPTLAVDIPSGLDADNGTTQALHVRADHTLSLLTLKPGLLTAQGRDVSGDIWFNCLGMHASTPPQALLIATPQEKPRRHASHKGSYGDVAIVGGAPGMLGAALLAGRSALYGGAGRVYVALMDTGATSIDPTCPELMFRDVHALPVETSAVVAGCGGGQAIAAILPALLHNAMHLVLDADALNHLAQQPSLQTALTQRKASSTVITPHPLEAARLLGTGVAQVQARRLYSAQALADRYGCTVVLKGSGTVIAAPEQTPRINPTGNARLATAGTGDVLAGLVGAYLAQGMSAIDAASAAVYRHGAAADRWHDPVLNASGLCQQL